MKKNMLFSVMLLFTVTIQAQSPRITSWLQNTTGITGSRYAQGSSTLIPMTDSATSIQGHPELLSRHTNQQPIRMGEKEKIDLMAFLLTLSDRKFVLNKEHWDPQLELKSTLDTNKLK